MQNKKISCIVFLLIIITLNSCKQSDSKRYEFFPADTLCCFTLKNKVDYKDENLTSRVKYIDIIDTLTIQGMLVTNPDNQTAVSVPLKGFIKKLYFRQGMQVRKGEVLAELEHPYYTRLQYDYLKAKSTYTYLKSEYTRQGELGLEHATSLKNVQKIQFEYQVAEAEMNAIEKQLKNMHIEGDSISSENIFSSIKVFAPASGIISSAHQFVGQLITEEQPLAIITDYSHLLARFQFPPYLQEAVKAGSLAFSMESIPNMKLAVEVEKYYRIINYDSLIYYATVENSELKLVPGMKIVSYVPYSHLVMALPSSAIINMGINDYALASTNDNCYKLLKVNIMRDAPDDLKIIRSDGLKGDERILIKMTESLLSCDR